MTRKLQEKSRRRLAAEEGGCANPWGGRLSVALVYPNTYRQAMSNLGFLTVYHLINARDDALCERFFLPDPEDLAEHRRTESRLFSLESGRALGEFDLVAFSISFENDYLNLPTLFDLGGLPLFARDRGERHPLVLGGGVCAFLNPEPLAEIMDVFAVGEAEPILPGLLEALQVEAGGSRQSMLARLARLPGVYVPALYRVLYNADGTVQAYRGERGLPERVRRQWQPDLDAVAARSFVLTRETEFGELFLSEISRGCSRGCRFCAAGFLYLPPRERSVGNLLQQAAEGLCFRQRLGLVGAAVSDYPQIDLLQQGILERGGQVSVSSLRIDSLSEAEVTALERSGHRTVALAPEAGSQRLRDLINKGLDEEQIFEAARRLAASEIANLKLYFLFGLPTETDADIDALLELVDGIRALWLAEGRLRGRLGNVVLSLNPFVPKPFTPLQWAPMEAEASLKLKVRRIRSRVARMPNVTVNFESLRAAALQGFFARGDRRTGATLPALAAGKSLRAAGREAGLDPSFYLHRERGEDEVFPWEILDNGVTREYLRAEYRRGLQGRLTPRCAPGCTRCGVCG